MMEERRQTYPKGTVNNNDYRSDRGTDSSKTRTGRLAMENVLEATGVPGRYQLFHVLSTSFCVLPFVSIMFNFVFIAYEPASRCRPINETELLASFDSLNDSVGGRPSRDTIWVVYRSCAIDVVSNTTSGQPETIFTSGCYDGHDYAGGKSLSMVTEWDLVCDRHGIVEIVQSTLTAGSAIGALIFPSICDRYGRWFAFLGSNIVVTILEVGLSLAPNVYVAIGLRFFSGLFAGGMYVSHYVMCAELIVSRHRCIFGVIHASWWGGSLCVLSGIAYLFRDNWRHAQLATALLNVPVVLLALFFTETPAFYFAKGRHDDTLRVLRKMSKMNGKSFDEVDELYSLMVKQAQFEDQEFKGANYSFWDMFRVSKMVIMAIVSSLSWFTISLSYYVLYLTSVTLNNNRYLSFFLISFFEIPACLIMLPVLVHVGRRTAITASMILMGVCVLGSAFFAAMDYRTVAADNMALTLYLFGNFFTAVSFSVSWTYTPELFPTTLRSIGTGLSASSSRIAGSVAPYFLPLHKSLPWAPGAILGLMCFVSAVFMPLLPETKGRQLPTTIEEVINWKKGTNEKTKLIGS